MIEETKIIECLGYEVYKTTSDKNEFRTWTTYYYKHSNGNTLLYNNSDDIIIVKNKNKQIILEGRFKLNIKRLINL